jgi:membrane protease YdiL (CAAX protease family)
MPDASDRPVRPGRLTGLAARHPLWVFLVLVFGMGWLLLAVPVLADRGLIGGPQMPAEFFALGVTWLVMLPAALWVTWATGGRRAVRDLLARAVRWRIGLWWAVVLLALPATTLVVGFALGGSLDTSGAVSALLGGVLSMLTAVLVIHLVEETVWAGFLQTRLERRHNLVVAALITSVPFSAIHLPLVLVGETRGLPILIGAGKLLLLGIGMRLMIGVFLRGTGSLLAVGLVHGVFNASNNRGGLVDGLLKDADQNLAAPIAMVVVTALVAVAVRRRPRGVHSGSAAAAPSASGAAGPVPPTGSPTAELLGAVPEPSQRAATPRPHPRSKEGTPC